MPYSNPIFDKVILKAIKLVKAKNFLDIGAGAGKYGNLVKDSHINSIGIELEKDYIKKFKLASIYDKVLNISVMDLFKPKYFDSKFDFVMFGDTIEHLKKSDGLDLLNFLIYRSRWIAVQFPHRYLQGSVDGYHAEAHISIWTEDDFKSFENTGLYKTKLKGGSQRLIILKGYLENVIPVKKVEALIKKEGFKK